MNLYLIMIMLIGIFALLIMIGSYVDSNEKKLIIILNSLKEIEAKLLDKKP